MLRSVSLIQGNKGVDGSREIIETKNWRSIIISPVSKRYFLFSEISILFDGKKVDDEKMRNYNKL